MVSSKGSQFKGSVFPLRTVVFGALVPSLVFGIAIGIILPLIPLSATHLGGDLAVAGLVAAMLPVGKIMADMPAGILAARIGDRPAMLLASVLGLIGFTGAALALSLWLLMLSILALGVATAVFHLARHSYLTEITPKSHRARVLSTLGGMHRLGYFIGPVLGAAVITFSSTVWAYWLAASCALIVILVLLCVRAPSEQSTIESHHPPVRIRKLAYDYRRLFLTLGTATLLTGAVRGARLTVLPLWGEYQGFDPEVISLIFGLSWALDMLFFYPAGKIMDRFGRLWIALPSMAIMALAMALLPFTQTVETVSAVAVLLGIGNGIGAGIIMTLGADVAPPHARSSFLGIWRMFQDTGDAAGPLVIAAGAALGSLSGGIWITAVLGIAAAGSLGMWVPRYSANVNANRQGSALR